MEELADMSAMFDLMRTPEGISPIERLLNENSKPMKRRKRSPSRSTRRVSEKRPIR